MMQMSGANHVEAVMQNVKTTKFEATILEICELFGAVYTVPSAAKALGVERNHIYQLLREGRLEGGNAVDDNGDLIKVLISKRSVLAYKEWRDAKAARPSYA